MKTLTLDAKSFLASVAVLALVGMAVGVVTAQGTDEASVAATVTAELVTISVANGSVAYGVLPVNTNQDTVTLGQTQVVTNDGNVAVDLEVKSSDAVGGTNWDLAATNASLDDFTHEFSSNDGGAWTLFSTNNDTYTSFAGPIATSGNQNLDLRIKTPTSVTDTDVEKTITVTVLATAN